MSRLSTLATTAALSLLSASAEAGDLRCGGRLVGEGDEALLLRARCGEPDHVFTQVALRAEQVLATPSASEVTYVREPIEVWTYRGEPGDLVRQVTVARGRVTAVRTAGHAEDDPGCERAVLTSGMGLGEVQLRCGPAADASTWEEEKVLRTASGLVLRRRVAFARLVYAPGPHRLVRILTFMDGRLVKQENGPRASLGG